MVEDDFLLSGYRRILETALTNGYDFMPFENIGRETAKQSCLLRHDVDAELMGCAEISAVERDLGIQATYFLMTRSTTYNLFSVEGLRAVEGLLEAGHRLGLHFMGELCETLDSTSLAERVAIEKAWLEREFGQPIRAVSFHQPTQRILDGSLYLDGLINTYNRSQMKDYFYVSDTNMTWRHEHPAEIFARGLYPKLHLLIHPIWWTRQAHAPAQKWLAALRAQVDAIIDHWERRERTLSGVRLRDQLQRTFSED